MADIYVPNPTPLMATPQFRPPQDNTLTNALSSGLSAATDVANTFRQKQLSVDKANKMADALEREGMTSEARLYRSAADSYQMNFFNTPAENEKFNQSLLNDTLKLLSTKQERELKARQLAEEERYHTGVLQNQKLGYEATKARGQAYGQAQLNAWANNLSDSNNAQIKLNSASMDKIEKQINAIKGLPEERAADPSVEQQYKSALEEKARLFQENNRLSSETENAFRRAGGQEPLPPTSASMEFTPFNALKFKKQKDIDANQMAEASAALAARPDLEYVFIGDPPQRWNRVKDGPPVKVSQTKIETDSGEQTTYQYGTRNSAVTPSTDSAAEKLKETFRKQQTQ